MPEDTNDQRQIAFTAIRQYVDGTTYGRYISDQICYELADKVLDALRANAADS